MTGDEFKRLRNKLGWTGIQLAEKFETDRRTIRRWELSDRIPVLPALAITCLAEHIHVTSATVVKTAGRAPAAEAKYRDQEVLTGNQAADFIGISRRTLLVWKSQGRVPDPSPGRVHDGKQWREVDLYAKADLEPLRQMVAEGRRAEAVRLSARY